MKNISTRSKPTGNALESIVQKFLSKSLDKSNESGESIDKIINQDLNQLKELVNGFDFVNVLKKYIQGHEQLDEDLKFNAIRWLRAEYSTKTEARDDLGVRTIIDDTNMYDQLKLMAIFMKICGYGGLLVGLDEMVNLYKLNSGIARKNNYEQLLRIINDCLQGNVEHIGFLFNGTPEFLLDTRKGLYSYEALQSRLQENRFAHQAGVNDFSGPVIRLNNLEPEDLYILIKNIRHVYASGNVDDYLIPDSILQDFLAHCNRNIGAVYFQTPRNTIKAFIDLLTTIHNYPELNYKDLVKSVSIEKDFGHSYEVSEDPDDTLNDFIL